MASIRVAVWVSLTLLLACDPKEDRAHTPKPTPTDSKSSKASPLEDARRSVTAHMADHVLRARAVHDAVALGKLEDARRTAKSMAEHWPDQVLETWLPFVRALRSAAADVERAQTVEDASRATASLARSCGECHRALGDGPKFVPPPAPAEGPEPASMMRRHRWAADRLWEGVVQASQARWEEGLSALGELPPCQEDLGGEQLAETIEAMRTKTEQLRIEAGEAKTLDARARIYGDLLGTCSACHLAGC